MPTEQIGYVYRTKPWSPLDFRRYAKSSDAADGGGAHPKNALCFDDGMADMEVSNTSAARRMGSSPI